MEEIISINPATLEEIGRVPITPPQKVKEIVSKAHAVFPSWSRLSIKDRVQYISKAREYLLKNVDDIAYTITRDNGKTLTESISAEILPVADLLTWIACNAEKILKPKRLGIGIFDLMFRSSYIGRQPLGVIGVISPWNYPFSIPVGAVAMALAAGNCVILKPSSATALVGSKIDELFKACGFPESVFTSIAGGSETGEALLNSRLDKVIFTGSVGVGRHVAESCAARLTPVVLELGGKDAAIIRSDADIEHASSGVVWGAFTNSGQCCASIERVYVHESIAEKFISLVVEKTKKLRVGNGENPNTDMGPMTTSEQLKIVETHVEEAKQKGGKILCGGKGIAHGCPTSVGEINPAKAGHPEILRGYFFEPTVITGVDHTFACVNEETFGPILPIMTYQDDKQAIQLANYSEYGLNAYIWSKNIGEARKMASKLHVGTVIINDSVYTHALPQTPWGGIKHSGVGRTHGRWGFYEVTNLHHTHINRLTFIKDFWWYPYSGRLIATLKTLTRDFTGTFLSKLKAMPAFLASLLHTKN
jgi:succinate-semialdehyde dehydrogenase/glutarate-semialdehyde dehydrogenase